MSDRAAIIAAYEECEAAARRSRAHPAMLDMADVRTCAEMATEECGVSFEQARAVLIDHWVTPAH